jgi:hypothetical protein
VLVAGTLGFCVRGIDTLEDQRPPKAAAWNNPRFTVLTYDWPAAFQLYDTTHNFQVVQGSRSTRWSVMNGQ